MLSKKEQPEQRLSSQRYFAAGASTGFVAAFVEGPIDLVVYLSFFLQNKK